SEGYQIGFIIAPVFLYEGWKEEYKNLIISIKEALPKDFDKKIIFEVISHRYTTKAKNRILEIYPDTLLPMENEDRKFKYGQFGYGKYVYDKEQLDDMKEFFLKEINGVFKNSLIKYII
uniref:spore photoproduct lyase family protein n=1 Tax=Clostridioides difficile TaxID=1496 RepID=UPI002FE554B7